ncbi:pleckstrin homology domain-containing family O member 2-like isoform X1 [Entelurus aequoreus]|uniref:pleckstrin homology domain-containing family O member 2-like isoform X1 n=1 Tax=Entelurus aequoreus TaxID=161455 RepID=UPI002B1D7677|nr:pleckstrin homology domain-containing family O member 2-like isoform X1 [Entelurus aequoreus]
MEHGTLEEPVYPKFLGKAGWVKKAPCRLLAKYKERYIEVERTDVAIYENEDLKSCIERLDLDNYDKCHELKSPFRRKQRLILIRSPKSGNKVPDMIFQAQTAVEKEAWIKALSEGISRAKNKVLDEVKLNESSNLQHFTRARPQGIRNRRPPTRIHMKELAELSSEGMLRLGLATMPNSTYDDVDTLVECHKSLGKPKEPEVEESRTQVKALMLPMVLPEDSDVPAEEATEGSYPVSTCKKGPPPTTPNLASNYSSELPGDSQFRRQIQPPTPPTKDKKPLQTSELNQEAADRPEVTGRITENVCNDEGVVLDEETNLIIDDNTTPEGDEPSLCLEKGSVLCLHAEEIPCNDLLKDDDGPILAQISQVKANAAEECVLNVKCEASSTTLRGGNIGLGVFDSRVRVTPDARSEVSTLFQAASFGDLLSDSSVGIHGRSVVLPKQTFSNHLAKVENELMLEVENTKRFMSRVVGDDDDDGSTPEELLSKAMEKLKKADQVLTEVKKLQFTKTLNKRNSW